MGIFDSFKKAEARTLENPNTPFTGNNFFDLIGFGNTNSTAGVDVTIDNALGVPSIWAAVNFISGTLASLPIEVFNNGEKHGD